MSDDCVCTLKDCPHYDVTGVGNCLEIPPDECRIKSALDRLDRIIITAAEIEAERDALKQERNKERVFVEHIKNHLKTMSVGNDVECRICDKTIDEIYEEEK